MSEITLSVQTPASRAQLCSIISHLHTPQAHSTVAYSALLTRFSYRCRLSLNLHGPVISPHGSGPIIFLCSHSFYLLQYQQLLVTHRPGTLMLSPSLAPHITLSSLLCEHRDQNTHTTTILPITTTYGAPHASSTRKPNSRLEPQSGIPYRHGAKTTQKLQQSIEA